MANTQRIAVVGAATRGASFFQGIQSHPQADLYALCDRNMDGFTTPDGNYIKGLREVASEAGVERIYEDYETMLDHAKPDVVVVGTPMNFHVPHSIMALERDMSVVCEVPVGVSIEECKQLVQVVKKSRGQYMMAENYCYIRENALVHEIAQKGLFGELYFAEGEYIHELKDGTIHTPWRRTWQTGINGCTYPTHSLGPVLQWFKQRVVSCCGFGTGHHYKDWYGKTFENEDSTFMPCRLEKGGLVNVRLDMISDRPHNLTYYSLQGTDGCYEAPRGLGDEPKIWLREKHGSELNWHPLSELEQEFLPEKWFSLSDEAKSAGHWGGDYMVMMDFIDAIEQGTQPPIDIHFALDMTLPGLVSQQSIQQGSAWLPVPDSRSW